MRFKYVNLVSITILLIVVFSTVSCKKSIEGCKDPYSLNFNPDADIDDGSCFYMEDKFMGAWTAEYFLTNATDIISPINFLHINFTFLSSHRLEYDGYHTSGMTLSGSGEWEVDGYFLELELDPGSDSFCTELDFRFLFDFDGDDILDLEENCNDGKGLKIRLVKV